MTAADRSGFQGGWKLVVVGSGFFRRIALYNGLYLLGLTGFDMNLFDKG